jgi:carboxypeptidase C (cathepsin A)
MAEQDTSDKKQDTNGAEAVDKPDETKVPPAHHDDAVVTTSHSIQVDGSTLEYTATAGRMVLKEDDDTKKASLFFTAYTLDGVEDPAERPIVFAFNGGPGSSSAWLHLGVLGPKFIPFDEEGNVATVAGTIVDNPNTLLTDADLVFIDPVSTGFARAIDKDEERSFHHFEKDIETVGDFVRRYLSDYERWSSPKFLAGESYGTTRSAGLAGHLLNRYGIYLNGVILISSVLNFQTIALDAKTYTFHRGNDLPYVLYLPSYTATAWFHGMLDDDLQQRELADLLSEVEVYTETDYLLALQQGSRISPTAKEAVATQLSRYTSLSKAFIERSDLRIEKFHFMKELLRDEGVTVGRLDSRYRGLDRYDVGSMLEHDPSLDVWMGPFSAMLNDYVRRSLGYDSDLVYEVLNPKVWPWNFEMFQNTYVDVSETLRDTMTRNPKMKVYIASAYFDLATPYFATEHTVAHLGLEETLRDNVEISYFDAGHMMYVHPPSIQKLGTDMRAFVSNAV